MRTPIPDIGRYVAATPCTTWVVMPAQRKGVVATVAEQVQHVLKFWASLSSRYETAEEHLQGWSDDVLPMLNANTIPNEIDP